MHVTINTIKETANMQMCNLIMNYSRLQVNILQLASVNLQCSRIISELFSRSLDRMPFQILPFHLSLPQITLNPKGLVSQTGLRLSQD